MQASKTSSNKKFSTSQSTFQSHILILDNTIKPLRSQKRHTSPGWCGSVDWVPAFKPKGHQFDSQSGHMPGLQARSPVRGVWEATNQCFSRTSMYINVSLSPFLPPPLKINKSLKTTTTKKSVTKMYPGCFL